MQITSNKILHLSMMHDAISVYANDKKIQHLSMIYKILASQHAALRKLTIMQIIKIQ